MRADLPPGLQAAQVGHALITWTLEHGRPPDNLVLLQVPCLHAVADLASEASRRGHRIALFTEPDLDDEVTAVALGPESSRLVSSLPLLMRDL